MLIIDPSARLTRTAVAIGLTCLAVLSEPAAAAEGWFTPAQATQGHQFFNNQCAQCHRPDLSGAAGPALVGPAFLATWANRPLSDLYTFEHTKMPAVNPGSVPPEQLWAITAYILQKNGFASGGSNLSDTAASRPLVSSSSTSASVTHGK